MKVSGSVSYIELYATNKFCPIIPPVEALFMLGFEPHPNLWASLGALGVLIFLYLFTIYLHKTRPSIILP